jgi:hypothetical protein
MGILDNLEAYLELEEKTSKITRIGDKGLYITGCLDQDHIDQLIELDKSLTKKEMIHFHRSVFGPKENPDLINYLNISVRSAILDYLKEFGGDVSEYLMSRDYKIATWKIGVTMPPHVDAKKYIDYKQALGPRPSITGLSYLTDDYEGGEIIFPEFNISIKPKAGSVIIFDSTLEHGVNEVNSGDRKTLAHNLHSIFDHDIEEFKSVGWRYP